jgi:5-methylcytosine-specific restriction endonuclease McrA
MEVRQRAAYFRVIERDRGICQSCWRGAQDVAHVLPRRYVSLKAEEKNLICLCRDCHIEHETYEGRRRLLRILHERYGYCYDETAYREYWDGKSRG